MTDNVDYLLKKRFELTVDGMRKKWFNNNLKIMSSLNFLVALRTSLEIARVF